MEVSKSKSVLTNFIILLVIFLHFVLLSYVSENSDNQKTFEKNIRFIK